ncbi:hypothetical protein DL96DRAFT_1819181 [Flagelloscypha sp. PMI_526]|nr:hypothetical protein DL96DRAFT_1819181 [Flagelloscypha sp. PMI_526]
MRQSQSEDLNSFFGTLVAHGNPRARFSTAGTTLQLTKDAGDAASHAPYVKAVAGVLSQMIGIRDDIRVNNERYEEIIDLVHLKSTAVLRSFDKVYKVK